MKAYPRIVFYGTPDFAVASLDALVKAGFQVVGVVTAPDKAAGRGLTLSQSAVKRYALAHQLPLFQPERLKSPEFQQTLIHLNPDIQVVVAFRMMPKEVWSLPPLGTFNLHASLLPQYRGAAPINRAIMNGESETGVTTFFINEEIDTGAILLQECMAIGPDETAGELHDRLMTLGATLVVKTVNRMIDETISPLPQGLGGKELEPFIMAPKIQKRDTQIDWTQDTKKVFNQVRGLNPYPGVYTSIKLKDTSSLDIKIGSARMASDASQEHFLPGEVFTDGKRFLKIATSDGFIEILTLQPASKKMMRITDFLNGSGTLFV
ncbi:MAG: methionyl-tRNA formyltransferase [Bacteroidales bacterium]|nr:methionyl-tRNA formyltransferase [Bacteroidales bacterium]